MRFKTAFTKRGFAVKCILLFFLLMPFFIYMQPLAFSDSELFEIGDRLFDQSKYLESISAYEAILKKNPLDYGTLWRLSRSCSKEGNLQKKKKEKKEFFSKAVEYAKAAVEINPNGFDGYLYLAEGLGKLSRVEDAEEKVRLTYEIRDAAQKAIELDPGHFKPYLILGSWHRKIEDASWLEKGFAKSFFGGLPDAFLEEAERNLKKSIELNPDFSESRYELALVYKKMNKKELAIKELEKALACPVESQRQEEVREDAAALLKKLK